MHFLAPGLDVLDLSGGRGLGVFARRSFARGELLAVWGGRIMTGAEVATMPPAHRHWVLQIEDDLYQASNLEQPELADYINHNCDANAGIIGQVALVAMRSIQAGEEICFDYAMTESTPLTEFDCWCGSVHCRGKVRADDWRRPELRRRYGPFFSAYLLRRMAAEASGDRDAQTIDENLAHLHEYLRPLLDQAVKPLPLQR